MNKTINLLDEVIEQNLETLRDTNPITENDEERKAIVKETTELLDKQIQLKKLQSAEREQQLSREAAKKEQRVNRVIKVVEVAVIPTVTFVGGFLTQRYFMRQVCDFEKDYTFTTSPAKHMISNLFRFKK